MPQAEMIEGKVSYLKARNSIQNGDLIAWKGESPWAKIVQWWTKSEWSHVGIACWWMNRLMVIESYPGKNVRAHPLSHDLDRAYLIKAGIQWTQEMHEEATEMLDLEYGMINNWKTALGQQLVKRKKNCAQLACDIYKMAGISVPERPTPASTVALFPRSQPVLLSSEDMEEAPND